MVLLRAASCLAVMAICAGPVSAQTLSSLGGPAEAPPAGYDSEQYVDSRGCVFIRAGYGGQETWVPRVTRDRQPLCGYQPSLDTAAPVAVAEAPAETPAAPVESPAIEIVVAPAAAQPSAPARPAAPPPAAVVAAARPAVSDAPATAPAPQAPAAVRMVSCQGLPSGAAQYMQGTGVRCGPQAIHPADGQPVLRVAGAASPSRHLDLAPVVIPEGYRPAWTDGRLNAARGLPYATEEGNAAMAQVWSETVPRVPVDPAADGVAVATRVVSAPATAPLVTRASSTPEIAVQDSAAAPAAIRIPAGHRYVEVARYSDRDSADAARLRLQQQGMPTRLGGIAQDGGGYGTFVVLAGPFDDPQALGRTLSAAHGLGYGGAVTR